MDGKYTKWLRALGPGLIFSGAAIGTSHLVQSTRAGADYGLALVGVIVLVNVLKYPSFRFAIDYSHVTRRPLLAGYREIGGWAPVVFIIAVAPIVPIILAAVSAVTAGILTAIVGPLLPVQPLAALVLTVGTVLLVIGGYDWLDRINRVLMALLVLTTLAATVLALPRVDWATFADASWMMSPAALLFVVALAGFMPTPVDTSMPLSLWQLEAESGETPAARKTLAQTREAFLSPYILTAVLALCFCVMGAGVMHSTGITPLTDAPGFAAQIVGLYHETLGPIPATLAAIAALSVMATTVIAVIDGYARTFAACYGDFARQPHAYRSRPVYVGFILLEVALAAAILFLLFGDFAAFVDLVTTLSFLIGPVIAVLNHLVVTRAEMPEEARPGRAMRAFNVFAILAMAGMAAMYFVLVMG